VDIHRAKEVLGDTVCFRGNVPVTLLCAATPEDVKAYVKELIDVVGKGGGLMVDCGIWFDEARHENVKAMVDFTKEYGVYKWTRGLLWTLMVGGIRHGDAPVLLNATAPGSSACP